ncbi:MAG: SMC family ATPase [Oscillospiraceae bacterium]|nr:SMC family ATPase [Oscillospiraceae bacterium]
MRPLHLEMTAFGSYAGPAVLPFAELRHGLYLVTGDTGAGKTTIFDAIMFALFGVASGSERRGDMLHCDYVPKSTDTVVKLRFSQNGKEYTVERRIHFSKKRGAQEQYGDGAVSALLIEPDRAPIEGAGKVTARCEELLGLNAEQFRRIIMLAQGEFKKFLKADSDEKNEILGKLFDNSAYLYYQNLLLAARDELKRRRSAGTEELRSLMVISFQPPQELDDASREGFLPAHPELIDNLRQLVREETERLEKTGAERDAALKTLNEASKRQGEAASMNALIEELAAERARLAALEARDGEMRQRQAALDRADAALHKALPAIRSAAQAETELALNMAEIEDLKNDLVEISQRVTEAEAAVSADEAAAQEQRELESRIHAINEQLPRYAALTRKRSEKEQAEKKLREASSQRAAKEEEFRASETELLALRETLDALEGADAALAACQAASQRAGERVEALSGETGLSREIAAIRELEVQLEAEKEALIRLTDEAGKASADADALYQKFIAAQAAVLANDLRRALAEDGEAACPVCGTHLHRGQLARLAQLPEETPSKDEVDEARRLAADAERARGGQAASVQAAGAAISARRQAAVERAAGLLPGCDSWEALIAPGVLETAVEDARQNAAACRNALSAAQEQRDRRDGIKKALPEKEQAQKTAQREIEALRGAEQTQRGLLQAAEAAVNVLEGQIDEPDEALASEKKARLEARVEQIIRQIQQHRTELAETKSGRDTILGSLAEKENAALRLTAARSEAFDKRDRALEETGFEDADAALSVLAPLHDQDPEVWIRAERQALSAHEIGKAGSRELIRTRQEQTEGRQLADLSELERQKEQLSEAYRLANEAFSRQDSLLKNHSSVLDRAAEIKQQLADSDAAWKRLDGLASLAGGVNSESGRLSFDRYVMGAMFREILEMANRRMELMSGGRYVLLHKAGADRRNARAGLEIEVLDNNTGVQRSSGSLSGGETFFTSLALALGLSDVVQNHAGGRQMDALFIDEGFGTLSDDVLDKALDVLSQLTEGNRLVGIISHVDKLDESIPQKIRVTHGERGSTLALELA